MASINLNHLFYFYEVARRGSFTRASRDLLVAQSALSVQIKALESSLGLALFDRRRNGVALTEAGQRAFSAAERIFTDVDQLIADLNQSGRQVAGGVSVGTVNSVGIYQLPDLLAEFRKQSPDIQVRVDFRESEAVVDQLLQGKNDLAIVPWQRAYPELNAVPLTRHKMFLVAPPDHPLAALGRVSPHDLEKYSFVGYHEGMHTRSMIDALFKRMSLSIEYSVESSNSATIKQMVLAGMGLALLPEIVVAAELRRGQLARLDVPPLVMYQDVTLYTRKNRTLSRSATQFVTFLTDYFDRRKRVTEKRGH
ncbi:MAG TPA: LysR family transcriptional regulator [Candidatus Krumholzibacteria bacterium]|nr:LysR family transcriptional regulator [Candidatus Krumholzibacteria bacterium]